MLKNIDCEFVRHSSDFTDWSVYKILMTQYVPEFAVPVVSMLPNFDYHPWVFAVIGSTLIGLSGVLPLLVIPIEEGANLKTGGKSSMF